MRRSFIAAILVFIVLNVFSQNREHAHTVNDRLGRGINYGNMFEAPSEYAWGNPWHPGYSEMIAELGFNHIRIPVRWEPSERTAEIAPYTINPSFLTRIKQVVDSALNNGLMAVVNMHHHEALYDDPDRQKDRFLAQWKQISEYFQDYPDDLLFEILNEPHGNLIAEIWNDFIVDALGVIREYNPDRIVIIGTAEYGGLGGLPKLEIPDDENIILTVHYYNPFSFTHQGAEWVEGSDQWLGTEWTDTETERNVIRNDFALLRNIQESENIPVHIGEFGAYSKADLQWREKWTTFLARYFDSLGWSWAYWEFSAGFGIYNPNTQMFNNELTNALINNPMPDAAYYVGTEIYASDFSQGNSEFNLYLNSGASGSKQSESGNMLIQINSTGTEGWHVQLVKNGITLESGKKYRITFVAKSDVQRQITSYVGQNYSPWSAYSDYNTITLNTEMNEYTYIFDMTTSDYTARLVFDIGQTTDDIIFESIKLEEVELEFPTSVSELTNARSVIFPNPVKDILWIDNRNGFKRIQIYNMQGIKLMEQTIQTGHGEVEVDELSSGIYFVSLMNQHEKITIKIIKR